VTEIIYSIARLYKIEFIKLRSTCPFNCWCSAAVIAAALLLTPGCRTPAHTASSGVEAAAGEARIDDVYCATPRRSSPPTSAGAQVRAYGAWSVVMLNVIEYKNYYDQAVKILTQHQAYIVPAARL
jgi:hypothetical protein